MRILGLLPNGWADDPERAEEIMAKFGRGPVITRSIMQEHGEWLKKGLPDWYEKIDYENTSPKTLKSPNACMTIDMQHVRKVVQGYHVIIAFGPVAERAVWRLNWKFGPVIIPLPETMLEANVLLTKLKEQFPW